MTFSEDATIGLGASLGAKISIWAEGCCIEGHRGVACIEPKLIRVKRRGGYLSVEGEGLAIASLTPYEIYVRGHIHRVEFA